MSSSYRQAEKKKKRSKALLPIMGLALAILLGVVAYFSAPALVELGKAQDSDLEDQFAEFEEKYGENTVNYIAAGLLWMTLLGLSMFLAAALVGGDPEKEALKTMGPSPADKKAVVKALKRDLKEAKKRAKQKKKKG
jgi:hypothetical protein